MDFAIIGPLVRPVRPRIRFLCVRSRFCSTLPSDPASRRRPGAPLHPSPPSGWVEDFHLQVGAPCRAHHPKKPPAGRPGAQMIQVGSEVKRRFFSSCAGGPGPAGRSPGNKPRAGRRRGAGLLPVNWFSWFSFSASPGPPGPAGRSPAAGRWAGRAPAASYPHRRRHRPEKE